MHLFTIPYPSVPTQSESSSKPRNAPIEQRDQKKRRLLIQLHKKPAKRAELQSFTWSSPDRTTASAWCPPSSYPQRSYPLSGWRFATKVTLSIGKVM